MLHSCIWTNGLPSPVKKLTFTHGVDPLKNLPISSEFPPRCRDAGVMWTVSAEDRTSSPVASVLALHPAPGALQEFQIQDQQSRLRVEGSNLLERYLAHRAL